MIKKLILISTLTASALYATNGVDMIGTSTISRSMGGTGVAHYDNGVSAIHKNPALMANSKKDEFQVDVTYFSAKVSSSIYDEMPLFHNNPDGSIPTGHTRHDPYEGDSTAHIDSSIIPTMGYVAHIDDKMNFGISMIGAAGMGVDYVGQPELRKFKSSMMLMKIIPALSYVASENVNFGIAPVLGLGSLSINYDDDITKRNVDGEKVQSSREGLFGTNVGGDTLVPALGYELGMEVKVFDNLKIGIAYNSSLSYTYSKVANFEQFGIDGMVYTLEDYLNTLPGGPDSLENYVGDADGLKNALAGYLGDTAAGVVSSIISAGTTSIQQSLDRAKPTDANLDDLTLQQPWEMAIGFTYDPMRNMTLTADYRYIAWGDADGYGDFGWNNQHVFALGFELRRKALKLRGGYNYASTPLPTDEGRFGIGLVDVQDHNIFEQALQMLNTVGFPAISQTHFTFGVGYDFTENLTMDTAFVFSPLEEYTSNGYLVPDVLLAELYSYEYKTKMEQFTASMGVTYRW